MSKARNNANDRQIARAIRKKGKDCRWLSLFVVLLLFIERQLIELIHNIYFVFIIIVSQAALLSTTTSTKTC